MKDISYIFKFIEPEHSSIHELVSSYNSPRDIFNWVRDNIKYIESSDARLYCQRPRDAIKRKLGNCKDVSFILQSAFELMKISSIVRIVYLPHYNKNGHRMYHAYNLIKYHGIEYTLDATFKDGEFGELPFFGEEIPVISLNSKKYIVFSDELLEEVNKTFLICGG